MGATGPWVVSILALVQVWVIGVYKWLRKGKIDIYETGNIEIGFAGFGPSVSLLGTLRARHKDVFVQRMIVRVVRVKDKAQYELAWQAFRPSQLSLTGQQGQEFEIASSFLVTPAHPHKYSIFFADTRFLSDVRPTLTSMTEKWHAFVRDRMSRLPEGQSSSPPNVMSNLALANPIFDEFSKTGSATDAFAALEHAFYWNAGEYALTLSIDVADVRHPIEKTWRFSLSDEDTRTLRPNAIGIIRAACGITNWFSFAYPQYKLQ